MMTDTYGAGADFIQALRAWQFDGQQATLNKATRLKLYFSNVSFVGPNALADRLVAAGTVATPNGPLAMTDSVVVSQVVPNYQSDASDVVTSYNALIAKSPGAVPGFTSLEGYVTARVFIAGLEAHQGPFTPDALIKTFEHLPDLSLGIGATSGFSADQPPVLELRVGNEHPAERQLQEPLLLERGNPDPVLRMRPSMMNDVDPAPTEIQTSAVTIGRYLLHRQIARGGMATIHIARLMGDEGFSRIVAAKRLHPEFAEDADFVAMFLDEARIASKVHHPNVVPVLDVVTTGDEVILVQEYVHGVPLHHLLRMAKHGEVHIPVRVAVAICAQVLAGLHAAHETVDELGMPLNIVHRDVSPQNVMVAVDGAARLLDFGVAKASMAAHVTRDGTFKGKLAYSAPEQLRGKAIQQSDVYALSVVLWELIVGHRMHHTAQSEAELVATIMKGSLPTITQELEREQEWNQIADAEWTYIQAVDAIVQKGLAARASDRWATAADMERALVAAVPPAPATEVATWLKDLGKELLDKHDKVLAAEEASWRKGSHPMPRRLRPPTPAPRRMIDAMPALVRLAASLRGSRMMMATFAVLVGAAAIGAAVAMHSPSEGTAVAARVREPAIEPPAVIVATPPPVRIAPAAAVVGEGEREPPLAVPTIRPPAASVTRTKPRPPVRIARQAAPSAAATKSDTKPRTPAAVPLSAPADPPKASTDCNPPYYFAGTKKIFKPQCL